MLTRRRGYSSLIGVVQPGSPGIGLHRSSLARQPALGRPKLGDDSSWSRQRNALRSLTLYSERDGYHRWPAADLTAVAGFLSNPLTGPDAPPTQTPGTQASEADRPGGPSPN
jgi:hypothetical protein